MKIPSCGLVATRQVYEITLSWIITMFTHVCPDSWEPRLARLDQSGYINAWMGRDMMSWIQVRHLLFNLCIYCTLCICYIMLCPVCL